MFENVDVQGAIRKAIQTEKNAMDFYQLGSRLMQDRDAKRVFEVLAAEERSHAGHFFNVYTGSDIASLDAFLDAPPEYESEWLATIAKTVDGGFNEQKALELALDNEQKLEEALRKTAEKILNPEVRGIFELNAQETHNHYLMIESEYARVMGMVHESDIDTFVRE